MTTPQTAPGGGPERASASGRQALRSAVSRGRVATIALLGLIMVLSVHLIDRWLEGLRLDLTDGDIYSLSDGTEALLERMQAEGVKPVTATLYFSEQTGKTLPSFVKEFISYHRYLRSLLREYQRKSDGKLVVRFVDPVPDSDDAQRAADLGLDGKLINEEGDLFYFGLAFENQTGSREAIEFLWPAEQENVEYEISKTLHGLLWPDRERVGVLSSLAVFGSADDPYMAQMMAVQGRQPTQKWISLQLLEELYELEKIDPDVDEISNQDLDLLVVIHPKGLPRKTVAAVDTFVQRGGNALILVDPYSIADQAPQNPQQPWAALQYQPSSNLPELFAAWGISLPENTFAADLELAVRRPVEARGAAESVVVDLAIDQGRLAETLDTQQPMLRGLNDLRFLLSGVLEPASAGAAEGDAGGEGAVPEPEGARELERLAVVTTTESGGTLVVAPGFGGGEGLAYTDFNAPAKLRDQLSPRGEMTLAYLLRGRFPSAFPEGLDFPSQEPELPPGLPPGFELPPPEDAEMIHRDPVPESEREDAAVLVFADVDFVTDQLAFAQSPFGIVQAANDNHRLFLNAVDFLLGSEELMAIRAGKTINRPFDLFDEIENAAERETLDRERQIRDEITAFEDELRDKQSGITSRNASLFQRRVQEEVDELNRRIQDSNRELREIRKERRRALEREESRVRFAVMGWMPIAVLGAGLVFAYRRGRRS